VHVFLLRRLSRCWRACPGDQWHRPIRR